MNWSKRWVRNRVTEKDVRDYLTDHGYRGSAAHFEYLESFAIQLPGGVQVFIFHARTADRDGGMDDFYGVVRDDERRGVQIQLADSVEEQEAIATRWSEGLIRGRNPSPGTVHWMLLAVFGAAIMLAAVGALVTNAS